MGLLAEQKFKQKWSVDPNNLAWRKSVNEKSFGKKLMSKMGWKEGQGLGKYSKGQTNHLTARVKNDNFGLGCTLQHQNDFTAGQDEFNAVLKMLNENDTSELGNQKRQKKRAVQRKALNSRFVKAKDLSNADSSDLSAIFGVSGDVFSNLAAAKVEAKIDSDYGESGSETTKETKSEIEKVLASESVNTTTSTMSYQDYFKQKMAKKSGLDSADKNENQLLKKTKKSKKTKRKIEEVHVENTERDDTEEAGKLPKKKKKKRKNAE